MNFSAKNGGDSYKKLKSILPPPRHFRNILNPPPHHPYIKSSENLGCWFRVQGPPILETFIVSSLGSHTSWTWGGHRAEPIAAAVL